MCATSPRDRRLERFFDYAVDLLCVGDLFGCFLRANRATVDTLGFSEEELQQLRFTDLVHPDDQRRAAREYVRLSRGQPTHRLEVRYRCRSGEYKWIAWSAWSDLSQGLIYAVGRDFSERRQRSIEMADEIARRQLAEFQLRQAHEVAVEASQSKSAFLANTSHEIRTPINAILGMAQALDDEQLTPQQADYVNTILQACGSLSGIVDDILDLSKIEAGQLKLEVIPFAPRQVIEEARRTLATQAQQKGIELTASIDDSVPASLTGDPGRLRQILLNLLSNAVKFTDEGAVRIRAVARQEEDACELEVSVEDSGAGIPADRHEVIFSPFMQADSSTTRTHGGTGLGLSICHRFVDMMGGRIWVDSEPGQGSVFRFTAVFGAAEGEVAIDEAATEEDVAPPSRLRILLVEDNPLNRKVVHALLRNDGHDIVEAHNGRLALEEIRKRRFDVVLMDLQMPELDGYETTRQIRQQEAGATAAAEAAHVLEQQGRAEDLSDAAAALAQLQREYDGVLPLLRDYRDRSATNPA